MAPKDQSINVEDLFAHADNLEKQKREVLTQIGANRDVLRNLSDAGLLTADQKARVDKLYPRVKRTRKNQNDS